MWGNALAVLQWRAIMRSKPCLQEHRPSIVSCSETCDCLCHLTHGPQTWNSSHDFGRNGCARRMITFFPPFPRGAISFVSKEEVLRVNLKAPSLIHLALSIQILYGSLAVPEP